MPSRLAAHSERTILIRVLIAGVKWETIAGIHKLLDESRPRISIGGTCFVSHRLSGELEKNISLNSLWSGLHIYSLSKDPLFQNKNFFCFNFPPSSRPHLSIHPISPLRTKPRSLKASYRCNFEMTTDKYYLDIGGARFTTTRTTLLRIPYFDVYFQRWDEIRDNNSIANPHFVDQNGDEFQYVLNWARNPTRAVPAETDLSFWDPSGDVIPVQSPRSDSKNHRSDRYATLKEKYNMDECLKCGKMGSLDDPFDCHHFNKKGSVICCGKHNFRRYHPPPLETCFFCGQTATLSGVHDPDNSGDFMFGWVEFARPCKHLFR